MFERALHRTRYHGFVDFTTFRDRFLCCRLRYWKDREILSGIMDANIAPLPAFRVVTFL